MIDYLRDTIFWGRWPCYFGWHHGRVYFRASCQFCERVK